MHPIFYKVLFIVFVTSHSFGQPATGNNKDIIEWNEFYTLTWDDFQGQPTAESIGDAGSVVQIKAKPFYVKKKIVYDVYAYFNKKKSWASDQSDLLLKHEQLHFDIAELYARKIRKQISDMQARGVNDVKVYNAAIQQLLEESNKVDIDYDAETLHGSLLKKQAIWSDKIGAELLLLKDYKKQKRVITSG
jgi:hypothetical protein